MSNRKVQEILQQVQDGELSDYEARRKLEREIGDCSCMEDNIRFAVRHAEWGRDTYRLTRRLEDQKDSCELEEQQREEEERRRRQRRQNEEYW